MEAGRVNPGPGDQADPAQAVRAMDAVTLLALLERAGSTARRRPGGGGLWVTSALVAAAVAWLIWKAATNPAFEWDVVAHYLFHPDILNGLFLSLWLTALVVTLGFVLGTVLAFMKLSRSPILRSVSGTYLWLFRSVPLLVQLLFLYNISYIIPRLTLGIPFSEPLYTFETKDLIGPLLAAIIALTLHEAAYAAEIVRGGVKAVEPGLVEAGHALGMSPRTILRHIIFPQAMPVILPGAGNLIIGTIKGTAIVSVIAVSDLLYSAQMIYNENYKIAPLLVVATFWYVTITSVLTVVQMRVEKHFAKGALERASASRSGPSPEVSDASMTTRQTMGLS